MDQRAGGFVCLPHPKTRRRTLCHPNATPNPTATAVSPAGTKECPRDAIHIYRGCYALVDEAACIGCKKCAKVCPADCIAILPREVSA